MCGSQDGCGHVCMYRKVHIRCMCLHRGVGGEA